MKINDILEIMEYFQDNLYEMSNFNNDTTGLPNGTKLWIREEPKVLPHTKYRVKIEHPQHGSAIFALWGDEAQQVGGKWKVTGKDLKKIQMLIYLVGDSLRNHIDGNEDSRELANNLLNAKSKIRKI